MGGGHRSEILSRVYRGCWPHADIQCAGDRSSRLGAATVTSILREIKLSLPNAPSPVPIIPMELRQLRYFVRIVELGSMGRAAVDLDMVQSV